MEKPEQVVSDPVGTDSEDLIADISGDIFDNPGLIMTVEKIRGHNDSLDEVEKRCEGEDESHVATGASESVIDAVIPPSIKAVNTVSNNNDHDDNNKSSSGNNVFNSATIINDLEEELGIGDGLDNAGIVIEMSADHGSSKRENANSFRPANVLGHSRRHSLRNESTTRDQSSNEKFPEDSYSFIALNGPEKNRSWSRERLLFFLFGFLPFIFQMVFLGLLVFSQTNELRGTIGETDNPDNEKLGLGIGMSFMASFNPANSTPIIRWAQVTSLASYLIFPDASLQDIMRSIRVFPRSSKLESDDPFRCVVLSCFLRFLQGFSAMIVTLLLVLTSTTVVDIILNFTAINFISDLDEYAFSLAKSGEFSPTFQDEAERIANTVLPRCMVRGKDSRWKCNKIVGGSVSMFLLATLIFVFSSQDSNKFWVTGILRVQLQDSELNKYSGCFGLNTESSSMNFSRRTYHSLETGSTNSNTSFGYCRKDRQWILFKGKADPCDVRDRSDLALALSPKTDAFDISTVFDESWVTPSNVPIDLYFFDGKNETKIEEECKHVLGDGICDQVFNVGGNGYDAGDCCAATCTKSYCGRGGLTNVFGDSDVSGDGFEHCIDPNMYPITIQLNDITSNRDPKFTGARKFWEGDNQFLSLKTQGKFEDWMKVQPANPYFAIDCDGKNVMTAYIEESMSNKSQTAMVQDGAICTVVIRNTTTNNGILIDNPIFLIDYTIFHGKRNDEEDANVEILTSQSYKEESVTFQRIPECYFDKLGIHYTDLMLMYTDEAIDWLLKDNTGSSRCEDSNFIERYALVTMNFAMDTTEITRAFIGGGNECTWPSIICNAGSVTEIKLRDAGLEGPIPSELSLLSSLETLQLSCDQMESLKHLDIPEELHTLDFTSSRCSQFPKDIFSIKQLERLDLNDNDLTGLPPSIGQLTNLRKLDLADNDFTVLPSSVGQLTSLQTLYLNDNDLTGLPPSIGQLANLETLSLADNNLTVLPSSIGQLTTLQTLRLGSTNLTVLPSSIGQLTNLETLSLDGNDLVVLPSSIGQLTNLEILRLGFNNALKDLPSSIEQLTTLRTLSLHATSLKELPSSIQQLTNLERLHFFYNALKDLPSWIGQLTNLRELDLGFNDLKVLPSSIGQLTNLETLRLDFNDLTCLPSSLLKVTSLRTLSLGGNQFNCTSCDFNFGQLRYVSGVDVDGGCY